MSNVSGATAGYPMSLQQSRSWRWQSACWRRSQCAVLIGSSATEARARARAALPRLLSAHEILRTRFVRPAGLKEPLQTVLPVAQPDWSDEDWSGDPDWRSRLAKLYAQALSTQDVESPLPPRVCWLRLDDERAVLLVSASALHLDGTSVLLFAQALLAGAMPDPDATLQYIDVSDELSAALESDHGRQGVAHWSRHRALQWEAGFVSSAQAEEREPPGEVRDSCSLSKVQEQAFSAAPGGAGVWLLACWQTLLQRRLRSQDLVVAVAFDGRSDEQLADVFGPLTRYLPVRTPADAAPDIQGQATALAQAVSEAHAWQEYFTWPSPREGSIWRPGYGFGFVQAPPLLQGGCLAHSAHEDHFEQKLGVVLAGERLNFTLSYDRACHCEDDMLVLMAQFRALLEASLAQPRHALTDLSHVSAAERMELLRTEARDYERCDAVHVLFSKHAQACAQSVALHAPGGQRWSYARLEEASNRLAHYLRSQAIGAEDRVGVCLDRDAAWIVSLLAVLKAGGVYVPIDPDFHPQRIADVLADAECALVLTDAMHAPSLGGYTGRRLLLDEAAAMVDACAATAISHRVDADQLAYLIYTSGSTGTPKGVGVSHRAVHNYVLGVSARLALPEQAQLLSLATIGADLGHTALFVALCTGRTLRLVPASMALDANGLAEELELAPVDCLKIVPTHLRALLSVERPQRLLPRRCLVMGGSALEPDLVARVRALAPDCRILNHYGPTETTVGICVQEVESGARPGLLPIGRALPNSHAHVLNDDAGLSGIGMPGELFLGGESVARGYWRRPDLTAERFVPDPFGEPGGRLYRTGDLCVRWANAEIVYLGRLDHQVKIRGYRVELGEIESVLRAHPAVASAVVVLAGERLCAYVVPAAGAALDLERVRMWLSERLPEYMVPVAWQSLEALPLTRNGKLDRNALPAIADSRGSRAYRAPASVLESQIADVWQQVLGVTRVGGDDNFFDLGGNSLLVTRVLTGVKRVIGATVSLSAFFEEPTVAGMAARIGGQASSAMLQLPLVAATRRGEWSIASPGQQRLWVTQMLEGATATYNGPHVWDMRGILDVSALESAFADVLNRHDVLRTVYAQREGRDVWQRALAVDESFAIEPVDVQHLRAGELAIEGCAPLLALIREQSTRVFDLGASPPFSVMLLKLAPDRHVLMFNVHHIASDGWSFGLLQRELSRNYNAATAGIPIVSPPLALQYADYALWQRRMLEEGRLQPQIDYWRHRLAGLAPSPLSLQPSADAPTGSALLSFQVEKEVLERLQEFAQARSMTLFMVLLAALNLLIARHSGSSDVAIGTSVAGRNRSEVEELIGFFVNQLVLRTDLSGDPSVEALMAATRETVLGALDHQDVPFSTLVSEFAPSRDASRSPFFQVLFVLQDFPDEPLRLQGMDASVWVDRQQSAKFDLTLYAGQVEGNLQVTWIYDTAVFSADALETFSRQLRRALGQMLEQPGSVLSVIDLMSEDERDALEREKQARKSSKFGKLRMLGAQGEAELQAKAASEGSAA